MLKKIPPGFRYHVQSCFAERHFNEQMAFNSRLTTTERNTLRASCHLIWKSKIAKRYLPWVPGTFHARFRFRSSLKKWPAWKASEPSLLIPKHPESGCFADWFLGDIECFKCSDWITITIGAWSERGWFEGDKDLIQTIQAHITYVFTFWKRIENIRCLYERKI